MSRFVKSLSPAAYLSRPPQRFAQAVAIGSISGRVTDQSGSLVPEATVTMAGTQEAAAHTATTK